MQLARSGPQAARAASRSRTAPRAASVAPMPAGGLALMTRARRMSHCGDSEVPGASRTASSRARSCTCCPHPSTQRCPGRWDVTGSHCSLQGTDASVQGGATVKWSKLSCRGPCARRCRDEASDSAAEDSGCRGWWGGASRGAELPPVRGGGGGWNVPCSSSALVPVLRGVPAGRRHGPIGWVAAGLRGAAGVPRGRPWQLLRLCSRQHHGPSPGPCTLPPHL